MFKAVQRLRWGCVLRFVSLAVVVSAGFSRAQTTALTLSSAPGSAGTTVSLPLSVTSTNAQPAALQWTLSYAASDVTSIAVTAGPAAGAAGKSVSCQSATTTTVCVLVGMNSAPIANGVIASIAVQLSSALSASSVPISLAGSVAASGTGTSVPSTAIGGSVSIASASTGTPTSALQSLVCSPLTLISPGTSTCTVSLSQPAPAAGAAVTLSSSSSALTTPPSITVAAGMTTATFQATAAAAVATNTTAQIAASWGGASVNSTITLTPPSPVLSSVTCSPATVVPNSSNGCTVALTGAAAVDTSISLTSSSNLLTVPPSVTVPAGAATASFNAVVGGATATATPVITAAYAGVSKTVAVTIKPQSELSTLSCGASYLLSTDSTTCTITLSSVAPAGGIAVQLQSSTAAITLPGVVTIPAGSSTGTFRLVAGAFASSTNAQISATANTPLATVNLALVAVSVSSLACGSSPTSSVTCNLTLSTAAPVDVDVATTSSNSSVSVPSTVRIKAGAVTAQFVATLVPGSTITSSTSTVTAIAGSTQASATATLGGVKPVGLVCSPNPISAGGLVICRADLNTITTSSIVLSVSSSAPADAPAPAQVTVQAGTNGVRFAVYTSSDASTQSVKLTISNGSGTADTQLQINEGLTSAGSDVIAVKEVVNAASFLTESVCSPGAAATVIGSGFSDDVSITVNGHPVSILVASKTRITFECPDVSLNTPLQLSVKAANGSMGSAALKVEETSPALFVAQGNNSAGHLLALTDTSDPLHPGDVVTLYGTGFGRFQEDKRTIISPLILVDGIAAEVVSTISLDHGVYALTIRIPNSVSGGESVNVDIRVPQSDGSLKRASPVGISIVR